MASGDIPLAGYHPSLGADLSDVNTDERLPDSLKWGIPIRSGGGSRNTLTLNSS